MRGIALLLLALVACGGDGAVGAGVEFEQVTGMENEVIFVMQRTDDGLFTTRGLKTSRAMHVTDGNVVALATTAAAVYRATAGPDGTVYFTDGSVNVYRVEPPDAPVEATVSEGGGEIMIDGAGGMYVVDGSGISYRAPGATAFVDVELDEATIPLVSLASVGASSDAAYAWNSVGGAQGILRMQDGAVERVISCDTAEFGFCNSEGTFAAGARGKAVIVVENVFSNTGGELYEIDGANLTRIASVPPEHRNIQSLVRGPDGDLYASASEDNTIGSPCYLYRLEGGQWEQLAKMPEIGSIAFGGDGRLYAAITTIGQAVGGLWVAND